jgi:Coenzyme PQQ synthesis protein D (PqqD)
MLQILSEPDIVGNSESTMPNPSNDILLSSVVVCSEENLCCDLQGEAVVLNLKSGTYFGLNPLGTRIWELIKEPAKVSDVHHQLLEEYEVDAKQCEAELLLFLNQLQANELIKVQATNQA